MPKKMTMQTDSFFINSITGESSYVDTRDMICETAIKGKNFIEQLWKQYSKHADKNFRTDAANHFQQRFWEMYIGITLENYGLEIQNAGAKGPEFFSFIENNKVWFEAIVPNQGTGKDAVPKTIFNSSVAAKVPEEKIILRIRHAIYEKHKQYKEYLSSEIIKPNDSYIIAINSKGIRFQVGEPEIPFIVKSVFPFGNLTLELDVQSCSVVKSYYSYRDEIIKENKSPVSTSIFLNSEYSGISAVLYSSVDLVNCPTRFGADFKLVHNPTATNPLKKGSFKFGTEYWLEDTTLKSNKLA